jgi:flotillin
MFSFELILVAVVLIVAVVLAYWVFSLRRVVSTNEVHIIQSAKRTVSFGKDQDAGNTYY